MRRSGAGLDRSRRKFWLKSNAIMDKIIGCIQTNATPSRRACMETALRPPVAWGRGRIMARAASIASHDTASTA